MQSLPSIIKIYTVPCQSLVPNIMEKHLAGVPIGILPLPEEIKQFGTGSCTAEAAMEEGAVIEKTTLQFNTTQEIDNTGQLAFIILDANLQYYIIGTKEEPYPLVEVTKAVDRDTNVNTVKVTMARRKSLIPCSV